MDCKLNVNQQRPNRGSVREKLKIPNGSRQNPVMFVPPTPKPETLNPKPKTLIISVSPKES